MTRVVLVCVLYALSVAPLLGRPLGSSGQSVGFFLKPMVIEANVRPGARLKTQLEIRHSGDSETRVIRIHLWHLSQNAGGWVTVDPGDQSASASVKERSCVPWVRLSRESVTLTPGAVETIDFELAVPSSARGFYGAALTVEPEAPRDRPGVTLNVRFLVPILIQVDSPTAFRKVQVSNPGLVFRPQEDGRPSYTELRLSLSNPGSVLVRVELNVRISAQVGSGWRTVSEVTTEKRRLLPGAAFDVGIALPRSLPKGTYKIDARCISDQVTLSTVSSEVEYEGDPSVQVLRTDAPLVLDPSVVEVSGAPGSTRTVYLSLTNPLEEPLEVACAATPVAEVAGRAMGDLLGESYLCTKWTTVTPARFTLRPGREQRIRLQIVMPREGLDHPYYYTKVTLVAAYPDGQLAGHTEALVFLRNVTAEPSPKVELQPAVFLKQGREEVLIQQEVVNVGNTHAEVVCSASLRDTAGLREFRSVRLSSSNNLLLPLLAFKCEGVMNLNGLADGSYLLVTTAEFAGKTETRRTLIRISTGPNGKEVEVLQPPDGSRSEPEASGSQGKGKGRR